MGNLYVENAEKWRDLASVDYITQFVKAWIAFNAWYKNNFPEIQKDGDIIKLIKNEPNKFKNKLHSLIYNLDDNESIEMKKQISNLHYQLERHYIYNNEKKISFQNIVIEMNPKNEDCLNKNGVEYKVTRNPHNFKQIESKITGKNGNVKLLLLQEEGYSIGELKSCDQFLALSKTQMDSILYCYEQINPKKPVCLISKNHEEPIKIGSYDFINDIDKICKGVITILYKLRNSLFHGQIIPDKETNKVYEPAYNILHQLVESL